MAMVCAAMVRRLDRCNPNRLACKNSDSFFEILIYPFRIAICYKK
jgi:hypothetical protein